VKHKVSVTIEKEYDIEIDDNILTHEFVKEFESYMFELDGTDFEEKVGNLFEYAARQLAHGEEHFVEGIGQIASVRTVSFKRKEGEKIAVVWNDTYESTDTEIVE
jgi:hypothetical protein